MRIPLDYYRILGIPIQVTDEQLRQAYQDRSLQLPRREYSERAIATRKQLLDEAYQVLSNPDKRSEYDGKFLETTVSTDTTDLDVPSSETGQTQESFFDHQTAWIEIRPEQLVGSLLLLQELGEYELVIRLGKNYLADPLNPMSGFPIDKGTSSIDLLLTGQNPSAIRGDVILTIALAYLELSREQWQQREYEKAADSGQKGLELLKEENLFTSIQQEIETDLYKLRPYRILELLALPLTQVQKRAKGLQLLQKMLQHRHGIDGKGEDYSGLNLDDFLRFIQQLRIYLTVEEQQRLFEQEAQRPSAVASYLKVYTQIAKGFAYREPTHILDALVTLQNLGKRQDVYLEQAICHLLLGQTEEAVSALEQTQETETLEYIQEQSQESPDLLPGLCRYGEQWLQTEVFSHFRDLINQQASLKKYFADHEVQNYLEQLAVESDPENQSLDQDLESLAENPLEVTNRDYQPQKQRRHRKEPLTSGTSSRSASRWSSDPSPSTGSPLATPPQYRPSQTTPAVTASLTQTQFATKTNQIKGYGEATREYTQGNVVLSAAYEETPTSRRSYRRRHQSLNSPVDSEINSQPQPTLESPVDLKEDSIPEIKPPRVRSRERVSHRRKSPSKLINKKQLILGLAVLLGLGISGGLLNFLHRSLFNASGLNGDYLAIQLHNSPLDIPAADAHVIVAGTLTEDNAEQILQEWLYSKTKAFGTKHQVERLQDVLADPMLSLWQNRARALEKSGSYYQYQHQVELKSLKINSQNETMAIVEAQVSEKANFYDKGKLQPNRSYNDNLLVRYNLIRDKNQWKIQNSQVVK